MEATKLFLEALVICEEFLQKPSEKFLCLLSSKRSDGLPLEISER